MVEAWDFDVCRGRVILVEGPKGMRTRVAYPKYIITIANV